MLYNESIMWYNKTILW